MNLFKRAIQKWEAYRASLKLQRALKRTHKAIPELNIINAEIEVIKKKHGKGGKALAKKRERIVTEALRGKA